MTEWRKYRVDEIADVQTGPFGSQLHMKDYVAVGTPIITVEHFGDNRVLHNNLPLVSAEDRMRLIKYNLTEGDIVFSRVGSVDRCVYITSKEDGWLFSGRCLRVRPKTALVDGKYLSYYFCQQSFKEYVRNVAVGATMPSINTQILSEAIVYAPSLPEQQAIAEVLSSLDDKIDLLHRNNKTLDEITYILFKQIQSETQELISTVGEQFETVGGGTPSTQNPLYWNGDINWLTPRDLSNDKSIFIRKSERKITQEGLTQISSGELPVGTVLMSSRAPIGYIAIANTPIAINQGFIGCLANDRYSSYYIYYWLKYYMDAILNAANGSTFDEISKSSFRKLEFIIPTEHHKSRFDQFAKSCFNNIENNEKEIETLSQIRILLLPKLMSGTLRVKDFTHELSAL